ncbi:MAG: hypothetical protein L3J82_01370 [Planctomycetes bacterium]|nr:hypothetical protein [Planctomycetota bacterium]
MIRYITLLLLLSSPLCAEAESNFGRVILAKSDAIVLAVASAKRVKIRAAVQVQLTVSETLYGDDLGNSISLFFNDPDVLQKGEAVRALFALKKLATGGFKLVGKPVLAPESGAESAERIKIAKEYIELEAEEKGKDRVKSFWAMLIGHVKAGGYAAENAAIELLYIARDRTGTITFPRFDAVLEAEETAKGNLTKRAKADLKLARKGMVEGRIKQLRYKEVRRGKKKQDKRAGASELLKLIDEYSLAFDKNDLDLINAMAADTDDEVLKDQLLKCSQELALDLAARK